MARKKGKASALPSQNAASTKDDLEDTKPAAVGGSFTDVDESSIDYSKFLGSMKPKLEGRRKKPSNSEVRYVDCRDCKQYSMERAAFVKWLLEQGLVCFNSKDAIYPFPTCAGDVFWPLVCPSPGENFSFDKNVCVAAPDGEFDKFIEELEKLAQLRAKDLKELVDQDKPPSMKKGKGIGEMGKGMHEAMVGVGTVDKRNLVDTQSSKHADLLVGPMMDVDFPDMHGDKGLISKAYKRHRSPLGQADMGATEHVQKAEKEGIAEEHLSCKRMQVAAEVDQQPVSCFEKFEREKELNKSLSGLANLATGKKTKEVEFAKEEDIEDWKIVVGNKGQGKSVKDLLVVLLKTFGPKLDGVDTKLDTLSHRLDDVNDSLSLVAERACRSNFGLFIESFFSNCKILKPITRVKLPYMEVVPLEELSWLCGKMDSQIIHVRSTPKDAEIDIFVRAFQEGCDTLYEMGGSFPTFSQSSSTRFSHFAIGEVTRSTLLCNKPENYHHPTKMEHTSSTKLLYKLVQLERDVCASLHHFNAPLTVVCGACVISPSFRDLYEPAKLLDKVLAECSVGLQNLKSLHQEGRLWLMDA